MQVADSITRHCPFLLDGDVVSLSPDFTIRDNGETLVDMRVGIAHQVHPPGNRIIHALCQGIRTKHLRYDAKHRNISELQLTEILGYINMLGGLVRQRPFSNWPRAGLQQLAHLLLGIRYSQVSWRHPITNRALLCGVVRATLPVTIASILLCIYATSAGVMNFEQIGSITAFGVTAFIASLWCHERAHVVIIRSSHLPAVLLQKGMRLGIVHMQMTPKAELHSAIAGPVCGIATALTIGAIAAVYAPTLFVVGLIVAGFHLGSFLPWYGDGISLWQTLRQRSTS